MVPDYTINDAFKDGFECGILYMLRYIEEVQPQRLTTDDIASLANHLEEKKQWKTSDQWKTLLMSNANRRIMVKEK